jgi:hypothetical protein
MHRKFLFPVFIICGLSVQAQSPRIISTRDLIWTGISFNMKFSDRWMFVSDGLYRFEYADGDAFQAGIRAGGRYTTAKGWQLTAGGVYFLHYPNPNGLVPRPELRGWQEIAKRWDVGVHHVLYPRIRFEQRFFREYHGTELEDRYKLSTIRLRLRGEYFYGIGAKGEQNWSIVAGDEIMFHAHSDGFTTLDQNRAWIGPQYRFSDNFTTQITYVHILQQRTSVAFEQFHVIRLTLQFTGERRTQIDNFQK